MTTEQKARTKVGDRIRITKERMGKHIGEVGTVTEVNEFSQTFRVDLPTSIGFIMSLTASYDDWENVEKTLHHLEEGDTVLDDGGGEVKVLGLIRPGLYVLEDNWTKGHAGSIFTAKELEDGDYTVKEAQDEPVKLTVREAAKRLGVTNLEIIEG